MILEAKIYDQDRFVEVRMLYMKEAHEVHGIEYVKRIPKDYPINAIKATIEDMFSEMQKRVLERISHRKPNFNLGSRSRNTFILSAENIF